MPNNDRPTCGTCVFMQTHEVNRTGVCCINPPSPGGERDSFAAVDREGVGCSQWTTPEMWRANIEFAALRVEFETAQVKAALMQMRGVGAGILQPQIMMRPGRQ